MRISSPRTSSTPCVSRRTCPGSAALRANRITPQGRASRRKAASAGARSRPANPVMNAASMRRGLSLFASVRRHPAAGVPRGLQLAAEAGSGLARAGWADDCAVPDALLAEVDLLHVGRLAGEHVAVLVAHVG